MNLKKKELVISIIMILAFLFVGFNLSVFATASTGNQTLTFPSLNQNNSTQQIPIISGNNAGNSSQNGAGTVIPTNTNNTNANNSAQEVPNTGIEDLPWLIIGVCAVSAIFAYKKIKDYNIN